MCIRDSNRTVIIFHTLKLTNQLRPMLHTACLLYTSYVTREELARMVTNFARATGRQMTPDTTEINFTDKAKISNFAKASVSLCQRCGIINGYEDGSFRPGNTANRGEAATLYALSLIHI